MYRNLNWEVNGYSGLVVAAAVDDDTDVAADDVVADVDVAADVTATVRHVQQELRICRGSITGQSPKFESGITKKLFVWSNGRNQKL